jgi:hypothetical protein
LGKLFKEIPQQLREEIDKELAYLEDPNSPPPEQRRWVVDRIRALAAIPLSFRRILCWSAFLYETE